MNGVTLERAEAWGWRMLMPALLIGRMAPSLVLLAVAVMRLVAWRRQAVRSPWQWPSHSVWWLAYYALQWAGGLWSENLDSWAFSLEVKGALLALPLILCIPGQNLARHFWWSVGWGLAAHLALRWGNALILTVFDGDFTGWRYAKFSGDVHPTYLSAYATVAWLGCGRTWGLGWPGWRWLMGAFFAVSLGLMGSKAGILAAVAAVLLEVAVSLWWRLPLRRVEWLTSMWFASLLVLTSIQASKNRFVEMGTAAAAMQSESAPIQSSSSGRIAVWRSSWELLEQHPFGVGTGDVTESLMALYARDGIGYALERKLNPHNQWLQAGVSFGWLGLVVFSLAMAQWFRWGWTHKDRLWWLCACILLMHAAVESILEVQRGVVFVMWMWVAMVSSRHERNLGS